MQTALLMDWFRTQAVGPSLLWDYPGRVSSLWRAETMIRHKFHIFFPTA